MHKQKLRYEEEYKRLMKFLHLFVLLLSFLQKTNQLIMQFLYIIIFCFAFFLISIEARRRVGSEYSQMLTKGKLRRVKWRNEIEKPTKRNGKRDENMSSTGYQLNALLNIQADTQTLTNASIQFVRSDEIDCTQGGARCIQRHTEGVEEQTISVQALLNTNVECDYDFESCGDYSTSNKFLQCITFGSNTIRVSCSSPVGAYVDVKFQGVSSNSFVAENGASARFIFGGIPTGEWKTEGYYQSTSAIVEVYCP